MDKEKQIKIPSSMFNNICDLLDRLEELYDIDDRVILNIIKELKEQIKKKKEANNKREIFTNYKTSKPHSNEREEARQQYLDSQGISKDFRTKKEVPYDKLH